MKKLNELIKEELLKESSNPKFTKELRQAYIQYNNKEVGFSSDNETLKHVKNALIKINVDPDKKLWTLVSSKDGDIFIERTPNSKVFTIKQSEEYSRDEVTLQIPVNLLDQLIKTIK